MQQLRSLAGRDPVGHMDPRGDSPGLDSLLAEPPCLILLETCRQFKAQKFGDSHKASRWETDAGDVVCKWRPGDRLPAMLNGCLR
jgi:hypothetical protein